MSNIIPIGKMYTIMVDDDTNNVNSQSDNKNNFITRHKVKILLFLYTIITLIELSLCGSSIGFEINNKSLMISLLLILSILIISLVFTIIPRMLFPKKFQPYNFFDFVRYITNFIIYIIIISLSEYNNHVTEYYIVTFFLLHALLFTFGFCYAFINKYCIN